MPNIIDDIKGEILESMSDVTPQWAEFCALAPLATIMHNARIIEKEKSLKLNLLMMIIALSGSKKSLPMFAFTNPIMRGLCSELERSLLLPSRYSVEGMINYVHGQDAPGVQRRDVGIMIRDEFSGLFKQLRKSDWQTDGMEFISEMYDGTFQKRATTSHGLQEINNLYACILTATTPYFLSKMDREFFTQGTGNRFLYSYYDIEKYELQELDGDYFNEKWEDHRDSKISGFVSRLARLYRRDIRKIFMGTGADDLWFEYKYECDTVWKERAISNPMGWDYHPIRRYPEFALKLSGIYAISAREEQIISKPVDKWDNSIGIEKKHMERAIDTMERNKEAFGKIVEAKNKNTEPDKPRTIEDEVISSLTVLMSAPEGILPVTEWLARMPFGNRNKKNEIRRYCLAKHLVKIIGIKEIDEETRLKLDMGEARVVKLVKYMKGL
jgi:hypothetical protein